MASLLIINHHYFRQRSKRRAIFPIWKPDLTAQTKKLFNSGFSYLKDLKDFFELETSDPGKYFHYTFDDGLKEHYVAFEFGCDLGCPPSFYISTNKYISGRPDLVHLIHAAREIFDNEFIVGRLKKKDLWADGYKVHASRQYRYDTPNDAELKYLLNFVLSEHAVREDFEELVLNEVPNFFESLYLARSEVQELCRMGVVGSHSTEHVPLGTLATDQQITCALASKAWLESMGGCNEIISYPYGGPTAVPHIDAVENIYRCGLTMERGFNLASSNPLMLRRIDTNDVERTLAS